MQRLKALEPETTTGKSGEMFRAIHSKLGMVPNMMRTMGNSPSVLSAYLSFSSALAEGSLGAKLGELIALTVANANSCRYCNAAHSFIAEKLVHIDTATIADAREGRSADKKIGVALTFAKKLVDSKGQIADADMTALTDAGYKEAEIAEIIAHVGLNVFTNYFNNASRVSIDFPETELFSSEAA